MPPKPAGRWFAFSFTSATAAEAGLFPRADIKGCSGVFGQKQGEIKELSGKQVAFYASALGQMRSPSGNDARQWYTPTSQSAGLLITFLWWHKNHSLHPRSNCLPSTERMAADAERSGLIVGYSC